MNIIFSDSKTIRTSSFFSDELYNLEDILFYISKGLKQIDLFAIVDSNMSFILSEYDEVQWGNI